MGLAGSTLDTIRTVFKRQQKLPIGPSYFDTLNHSSISYSNATMGPNSGYNEYLTDNVKMDQDLMSRYADYEDMDDFPEIGCFTGDTLVRTLDGPVRIDELARRYNKGETFKIFAYDRQLRQFIIADAHSARWTKKSTIIELQFDDGSVLKCTHDHKILTRTNKWKDARDFEVGDSVMPLQTKLRKDGYLRICHPEMPDHQRWESVYKMVARSKYGLYESHYQIHHIDFDKLNDTWDNLELLTAAEHIAKHSPQGLEAQKNLLWTVERRKKHAEKMRGNTFSKGKLWSEEQRKAITGRKFKQRKKHRTVDEMLDAVRSSYTLAEAARKLGLEWTTLNRRLARNQIDYKKELAVNGTNHKIIKIIHHDDVHDVYDLTTEKYHNFVANGVVVHNSAIDLYSDDATVQDILSGRSMWFEAENTEIESILDDMLVNNLRVEENLWEVARSLCKYGNEFNELYVMDGIGVIKMKHLAAPTMRRIEDMNGILYGFIHDPTVAFRMDTNTFMSRLKEKGSGILTPTYDQTLRDRTEVYEPWECVHFRLRSKARRDLYGYSVAEAARWAWKRLTMIEDAMVLYKITRSPQRYAYYVDVGDVPPQQALSMVNKVKNEFKKTKYIDPNTGKPSFRYNPLCLDLKTEISLLNGKTKTLEGLICDYKKGVTNWVYSFDIKTKKIVPGKISWAGVTRKNAKVIRVILNHSSRKEVVTPDHKFMLRDGSYCEAKDLKPGMILMPLNRGHDLDNKLEYIHHPGEEGSVGGVEYTHIMLSKNFKFSKKHKLAKNFKEIKLSSYPLVFKVKKIEVIEEKMDTGCITVDEFHNFSLKSGIFVKNSQDEDIFIPSRKGKRGTEIEVLSGPEGQQVEDAEYFLNKIYAALKTPKSYLGADETIGRANLCLVPETRIPLLDDRVLTMEELIEEHDRGIQNMVYSLDRGHNLEVGFIKDAKWTRKDAEIARVHLSNGNFIDATPDHRFMLDNLEYREAKDLKANEVLMPFDSVLCNKIVSPYNYGNYYQPELKIFVKEVEILTEHRDCCDIEIRDYHNFATAAGVFVHNSQMDVRFCRSVMRVQREIKNGYSQVARVHLSAKNIDPDRVDYDCKMVIPSGVFELAQTEVQQAKLELASQYRDANFSEYYVWSNILGLSDEEINLIQGQRTREQNGEGMIDGEESEKIIELMPKAVDNAQQKMDKKAEEKTQKILTEISKGQTKFSRRIKELKSMVREMSGSIKNQKYYNARK